MGPENLIRAFVRGKEPEGISLRQLHDGFRLAAKANEPEQPLTPFAGGVLAFHSRHIELCGETLVSQDQKGYAWRILSLLREKNESGKYVRVQSRRLAAKLHPNLPQNTLIQAAKALLDRITTVMGDQLRYNCGAEDVIANGGRGYHLRESIIVEECNDVGTLATAPDANGTAKPLPASHDEPSQRLSSSDGCGDHTCDRGNCGSAFIAWFG